MKKLSKWYLQTIASAQIVEGKHPSKMRQQKVNYALMVEVLTIQEPSTFEEACNDKKWKAAMDNEIHSIETNGT